MKFGIKDCSEDKVLFVKKRHILYVIDSRQHGIAGGAELHVIEVVKHLNQDLFSISCASDNPYILASIQSYMPTITLYHLKKRKRFIGDLAYLIDLFGLFKNVKPDLVHLHKLKSSVWGRIAGQLSGVPVIIATVHGAPSYWKRTALQRWLYIFLNTITTNYFSDCTIALTEFEKKTLVTSDKIRPEKIVVISNGIFLPERFLSLPLEREAPYTLAAIGRLNWEKNFISLINAMPIILRTFPHCKLLITGSGLEEERLHNRVLELHLKESVVFKGEVTQEGIPDILRNSSVLVIPSFWESFSYVAIEAMLGGVPIIGTKDGALSEIVVSGQGGILVDPNSVEGIATAVITMLASERMRKEYASYNRERALLLFRGERMMEKLATLYNVHLSRVNSPAKK